jgi:hypothetical protein
MTELMPEATEAPSRRTLAMIEANEQVIVRDTRAALIERQDTDGAR